LNPKDGSQGPVKVAKSKFPDIGRALAKWVRNEQAKGSPPNDSELQEQAQRFAGAVGNSESQFTLINPTWLENFKKKYNILGVESHSNFHESDGIHVVDLNTTSLSETLNSYTPVSSHSGELIPPPTSPNQTRGSDITGQLPTPSYFAVEPVATPASDSAIEESLTARQMMKRNKSVPDIHSAKPTSMQPPPVPPLPRPENASPVSLGSPTQGDARRALDLLSRFFQTQPAGFLEPDEYAIVGKLTAKLFSSISEGTAVLPGGIDKSLGPSGPKKRKVEAVNDLHVV
jgi:hypothetical protein